MAYPELQPSLALDILPTHNLCTLALADISFYPPSYVAGTPSYQIYPPNFPSVVVTFTQSSINIYNSNNLNLTCTDDNNLITPLPDGIWRVVQTINPPLNFTNDKSFLRVENLKHQLGLAFLKTDMINCKAGIESEDMKYLMQIWSYIQGAIAASNQCNMVLAMQLYNMASRTLKNYMKENWKSITTRTSWY
jgi:hypothetical protein